MDILVEVLKFGLVFMGVLIILGCLKVTIFDMAEENQGIAWLFTFAYSGAIYYFFL